MNVPSMLGFIKGSEQKYRMIDHTKTLLILVLFNVTMHTLLVAIFSLRISP